MGEDPEEVSRFVVLQRPAMLILFSFARDAIDRRSFSSSGSFGSRDPSRTIESLGLDCFVRIRVADSSASLRMMLGMEEIEALLCLVVRAESVGSKVKSVSKNESGSVVEEEGKS